MGENVLLAIERDGDNFKISIPDDPLLTEHMLEELIHQVKLRAINQAWEIRKQMQDANGNGIAKPNAGAIERFGRHRRS